MSIFNSAAALEFLKRFIFTFLVSFFSISIPTRDMTVPSISSNRNLIGFGAISGFLCYLSKAETRIQIQSYFYHFINEIGRLHILLFVGVCFIGLTRPVHPIASYSSAWSIFTSICAPFILNITLISLKIIACLKLTIALLRTIIKSRQFIKLSSTNIKHLDKDSLDADLQRLNNKCIICFDNIDLDTIMHSCKNEDSNEMSTDSVNDYIFLKCNHVFHSECFKEWYMNASYCPYCRKGVN